MNETKKTSREVKIEHRAYQPKKAELEADARIDATFDEAVKVLTEPVRIKRLPASKRRVRRR